MNQCKNCKHLGRAIEGWDREMTDMVPTGFHRCDYIKHLGQESWLGRQDAANAGVVDGSGYFAALVVKDDFGCVNFEPKE